MGPRLGTRRPITSDRRDLGGAGIATQSVRCPVAACCHSYCYGRCVDTLVVLPTRLTSVCFAHSRRRGRRGTPAAEHSECLKTFGTSVRSKRRLDRIHAVACRYQGQARLYARGLSRILLKITNTHRRAFAARTRFPGRGASNTSPAESSGQEAGISSSMDTRLRANAPALPRTSMSVSKYRSSFRFRKGACSSPGSEASNVMAVIMLTFPPRSPSNPSCTPSNPLC